MRKLGSKRSVVRLIGAAAIAVVMAAGPMMGSASAVKLDRFAGSGSGYALRVMVDLRGLPDAVKAPIETAYATLRSGLPSEAQSVLPATFPFLIDQRFIETLAEMGTAQKAQAFLSRGLINLPQKAEATKVGESQHVSPSEQGIPGDPVGLISASVGDLFASVSAGPKVDGIGSLISVKAGLNGITDLLPEQLTDAFDQLQTAINDGLDTVNATLDSTLGEVADTLSGAVEAGNTVLGGLLGQAGIGSDVVGDPAQLTEQLQSLVQIPDVGNLLDTALATINGLKNTALTQRTSSGSKVVSEASSKIASVDLLGLVHVGVVDMWSKSFAAAVPGSAGNDSRCSILDARVGDTNGVALDGEHIYLNGVAVPSPVGDIGALKNVANSVLGLAGINVGLCDTAVKEANPDGTAAAQHLSALSLTVAPNLPVLGQVVKIVVDPSIDTSAAARVNPAPVSRPGTTPTLPKTGAAPIATVLGGFVLAGAAIMLRRRFA